MARQDAPIVLIYGNQAYAVEQAAKGHVARLLGEQPADFAYHRFDAEELLRPGAADAEAAPLEAFQLACETLPFLCEHHVVRVDRLDAVRVSDKAAQTLLRNLEGLHVLATTVNGERAWALEQDLPALPEGGGRAAPVQHWVREVESRAGAPPVLHLSDDAEAEDGPRFALVQHGEHQVVGIRAFLRARLKGRFSFADEAEAEEAGERGGSAAMRLHALLERYAERPPEGLYLVLTARAARDSDLSRPLLTKLKAAAQVERFVTYDDYNPVDWVREEAQRRELRMGRGAAELLIHLVGNDLGRLALELDKLALVAPEGGALDEDTLHRTVHADQGGSLFAINERLGHKDLPGALGVLEGFLAETPGEHPVLTGILARHFRQLLLIDGLERQGVAENDLPSHLKVHPFIARKLTAQARRFTGGELEAALRALARLDVAAKQHGHLAGPLFRAFVEAVCTDAFRGRPEHPLLAMGDPAV